MCEHDLSDRETACADGMCPLCLAAENAALREREQQLQRALAFWHPCVRVDDVPEAATKRAADDACLLYGLEVADEQSAADLGWVAWVVPGEFARLRSRLAEATELLARAEDDLSEWERIHGDDPQTTRLRLEIMGFMAADSASVEGGE